MVMETLVEAENVGVIELESGSSEITYQIMNYIYLHNVCVMRYNKEIYTTQLHENISYNITQTGIKNKKINWLLNLINLSDFD